MTSSRVSERWFLAAMITLPVIQYICSPNGSSLMTLAGFPHLGMESGLRWWLWLLIGCVVVLALSLLSVRVWGAPARIWYVGLAAAALRVLALVQLAFLLWGPLPIAEMAGKQQVTSTFLAHSGFVTPSLYAGATVGYLVAMALGCWLGTRSGSPAAGTTELMEDTPNPGILS